MGFGFAAGAVLIEVSLAAMKASRGSTESSSSYSRYWQTHKAYVRRGATATFVFVFVVAAFAKLVLVLVLLKVALLAAETGPRGREVPKSMNRAVV